MKKSRRRPRYANRVVAARLKALQDGKLKPGQEALLTLYHDDWCDLLAGKGPCNCNPALGPITPLPEPPTKA